MTRTTRILTTLGILALAAVGSVAGFAAFSDTDTTTTEVTSGSLEISLADTSPIDDTIFTAAAPGDVRERAFWIQNDSTIDIQELVVSLYGADLVNLGPTDDSALQYQLHRCPTDFTPTITGYEPDRPATPIYAYNCTTTPTPLTDTWVTLAPTAVSHTVAAPLVAVNEDVFVRLTVRLKPTASPEIQGQGAVVTYTFDAVPRDGTTR